MKTKTWSHTAPIDRPITVDHRRSSQAYLSDDGAGRRRIDARRETIGAQIDVFALQTSISPRRQGNAASVARDFHFQKIRILGDEHLAFLERFRLGFFVFLLVPGAEGGRGFALFPPLHVLLVILQLFGFRDFLHGFQALGDRRLDQLHQQHGKVDFAQKRQIVRLPSNVQEMDEIGEDADVGRRETVVKDGVGRLKGLPKGRDGSVEAADEFVEAGSDGSFQLEAATFQSVGVVLGKGILVGEELLQKQDGGNLEDLRRPRKRGGGFRRRSGVRSGGSVGEIIAGDSVDAGNGLRLLRPFLDLREGRERGKFYTRNCLHLQDSPFP